MSEYYENKCILVIFTDERRIVDGFDLIALEQDCFIHIDAKCLTIDFFHAIVREYELA